MHRVLGQIEIAEQSDERGKNAAGFRTINGIQTFPNLLDCAFRHRGKDIRWPGWNQQGKGHAHPATRDPREPVYG